MVFSSGDNRTFIEIFIVYVKSPSLKEGPSPNHLLSLWSPLLGTQDQLALSEDRLRPPHDALHGAPFTSRRHHDPGDAEPVEPVERDSLR